ncbi:MAG: hypothetical protein AAF481_04795 [Acidobacteriota bacterium]
MRTAALGLALVSVIGILAAQQRGHAEQEVAQQSDQGVTSREFTLSADPTVKVLHIAYIPVTSRRETHLSLFGDGRFLVETTDRKGNVLEQASTNFSFGETRALVDLALSHGLADSTSAEIMAKVKETLPAGEGGASLPDDAGTVIIALELEEYVHGSERTSPFSTQVALGEPKILHLIAPSIDEVTGFVKLSERLLPIRKQLLEGGSN